MGVVIFQATYRFPPVRSTATTFCRGHRRLAKREDRLAAVVVCTLLAETADRVSVSRGPLRPDAPVNANAVFLARAEHIVEEHGELEEDRYLRARSADADLHPVTLRVPDVDVEAHGRLRY